MSRQYSGAALDQQRARSEASRADSGSSGWGEPSRRPSVAPQRPWWNEPSTSSAPWVRDRSDYYAQRSWSVPPYVRQASPSFGIWDAAALWFLLDTVSSASHSRFFYDHANDPGVRQWREQADRQADSDPAIRAKLATLDQQVAALQGQQRDPNYLPPDMDRKVATAVPDAASEGGGFGTLLIVLIALAVIGFVLLRFWKRRAAAASAGGAGMSTPLSAAANIIRHKLSSESYKPSLWRVGMTVTLDPTPFILAQGATKVAPPEATGGGSSGLVGIPKIGTITSGPVGAGGVTFHRLYLPNESFFQLFGDEAAGTVSECRYFSLLDEVEPAPGEWDFWIDVDGTADPNGDPSGDDFPAIGAPSFQTKDGRQYERAWSPGRGYVRPQQVMETLDSVGRKITRQLTFMLYQRSTGAPDPAPASEYALVSMVEEQGGGRFVLIHAGIDVNPAALSIG